MGEYVIDVRRTCDPIIIIGIGIECQAPNIF